MLPIVFDLPVMDGYELANQFRSRPMLAETRLIAITGYGQQVDRRRTADSGFAAHLVKPVDLDRLNVVLEGVAAGKEAPD
jgi:CheY-like chemotaxis protein